MSTNLIGEFNSSTEEWDLEHATERMKGFDKPFSALPTRLHKRLAAQAYLLQRLKIAEMEGYRQFNDRSTLWCTGLTKAGKDSLADVFARLVDEPTPQQQNHFGLPFEDAAYGLDTLLNDPEFIEHVATHRYHINTALWLGRLKPEMAEVLPARTEAKVEHALLTVRKDITRTVDTNGNPVVQLAFVFPHVEGQGEFAVHQNFPVPVGRIEHQSV